jgi:hypothetical protein
LSVSGLASGQSIVGTGIPAGATITAVSSLGSTITLSAPATVTATGATLLVAALAANGPAVIQGISPTIYQGFFNTAGAATSTPNNPAGLVQARSFGQFLAVLYNYNATTSTDTTQNSTGGFYPYGVSGPINNANS